MIFRRSAMLSKKWALLALFVTTPMQVSAQDNFPGKTDPSNYIFYDATDSCEQSSSLCITTFKYCSHEERTSSDIFPEIHEFPGDEPFRCPDGAKDSNATWINSFQRDLSQWVEIRGDPRVIYSDAGAYALKWQNNNPDYPTTVTLRKARYNGYGFYMYKVVDAGQTELEIRFDRIPFGMLPGNTVPANGTGADFNVTRMLWEYMGSSEAMEFTVGQPEDPKYEDKHLEDKNVTDMSKPFSLAYAEYVGLARLSQYSARYYISHKKEDLNKKWGIGLGVGVGLGGPILVAVTYYLGRRDGKKLATTIKRSNDINMADQPE